MFIKGYVGLVQGDMVSGFGSRVSGSTHSSRNKLLGRRYML